VPFYQRDRQLVRTALAKAKTSDGAVIEIAGIVPVTAPILARALGIAAEWEKVKADGEPVRIDPPKEVVDQIAAMFGDWPFPPITGVISTPTLRPDGTVLSAVGYDEATGFVLLSPPPMPEIPDQPTRLDADRAIELLQSLLAEFPFADEPSRAVAMSMIMTTVLRGALLPAVPMHVATAPQPGSGKSFLNDIASAISTGERCAVLAQAPNPEETEKRLIGAALAGQQIIAIDNVSDIMTGDFLNQVTERPLLQLRPLGGSDIIRVANSFTVFANGNNLSAPADLVRRTLVCRLDANLENPEDRTFEADPVRLILANRGLYVAACLTIGRAYICAGSPDPQPMLASFERWSNLVRSSLVWLGMCDPCSSMEMSRAEDPIRAGRIALFSAWAAEIGLTAIEGHTTATLIDWADSRDEYGFLCPLFREACLTVAAERSGMQVSPRRLGKWLSASNNNRVGDLKLTINRQDAARPRWVLSRVTEGN
jgi:putative DNA primase/helicase